MHFTILKVSLQVERLLTSLAKFQTWLRSLDPLLSYPFHVEHIGSA
jgi:hypothetical protein